MASINHYPAHTPEQVFTCEATAEVIGRTGNLPYLITVFYDYTDVEELSHGLLSISVQCKYPPYVETNQDGHSAVSLYGDGYDNFRMHVSWRLDDTSGVEGNAPYCYLNPVTIFVRDLVDSAFTLYTGRITSGESGYGLYYALEPIEDFPHVVDDSTIGQTVIEKYGGYNYCVVFGTAVGRVLTKNSTWTNPTASEERVVTHVKPRPDHTSYFYSSKIVYLDSRVIYGESFSSGAEWLAWCKAH